MILETFKPLKKLYSLATPAQRKESLVCVGVMLALGAMEIVAAALIVLLAGRITAVTGQQRGLLLLSCLCLIVFAAKGGLAILDSYVQNRWIQNFILDLKRKLIHRYAHMDYARQVLRNSAHSLSILHNDADIYMRIGLTAVGVLLTEATIFIVLAGFLLFIQPVMTLCLMALLGVLAAITLKKFFPLLKEWGRLTQETAQNSYQEALQVFQSGKDMVLFGKTDYFIERCMAQSRRRADVTIKYAVGQILPRAGIETVFVVFFTGMVAYFSLTGADFSLLTKTLSAYLYAGFRLLPGLNRVLIQMNNIKMCEASVRRVAEEMSAPAFDSAYVSVPALTFNHSVAVQAVSYRYPNAGRDSLRDISFAIRKGEFVGIVGETGAGKSTLMSLMLGLLTPTQGEILIDGLYPPNAQEWHKKIGYTAQDFTLIDGTVADNIAFGIPAGERDDALIRQTIKDAQLEKFVANLGQGINTPVGESGVLISGGEKQRIALARALYRQPEILMLDEATSALDMETESAMMQAVKALKDRRLTIFAITHRRDTLAHADRIFEIRNGQIAELKDKEGRKDVA